MTVSSLSERAQQLAAQGRVAEAFALLDQATEQGDGLAAMTLASWRMSGALIRRDLGEARRLYGLAYQLGVDEAAPVHIALLANGAGGSGRHWNEALAELGRRAPKDHTAAVQAALIAAMPLDQAGDPLVPMESTVVHDDPRIECFSGFLSSKECSYLMSRAAPYLAPSVVVDPRTGQQRRDPVRTANSAGFPFVNEDPVLHAINRRIAVATRTSWEQGEPLQVLCYGPGQEYKLHSDALPNGDNQRMVTFLVRLNDQYSGGATSFPRLGLELTGKSGDALFFSNIDRAGQADATMWHAGMPVTQGQKWLLSKWIRQMPLDLSGPPGRPF
jgi:prolyl 4-hydroxylase